ncbi:unnamed protein product [Amoebophrya sp. A25]|nr:unnamed protein product [Amoebophrya sp. A25]|eukprot:GSA25T00025889001.1
MTDQERDEYLRRGLLHSRSSVGGSSSCSASSSATSRTGITASRRNAGGPSLDELYFENRVAQLFGHGHINKKVKSRAFRHGAPISGNLLCKTEADVIKNAATELRRHPDDDFDELPAAGVRKEKSSILAAKGMNRHTGMSSGGIKSCLTMTDEETQSHDGGAKNKSKNSSTTYPPLHTNMSSSSMNKNNKSMNLADAEDAAKHLLQELQSLNTDRDSSLAARSRSGREGSFGSRAPYATHSIYAQQRNKERTTAQEIGGSQIHEIDLVDVEKMLQAQGLGQQSSSMHRGQASSPEKKQQREKRRREKKNKMSSASPPKHLCGTEEHRNRNGEQELIVQQQHHLQAQQNRRAGLQTGGPLPDEGTTLGGSFRRLEDRGCANLATTFLVNRRLEGIEEELGDKM